MSRKRKKIEPTNNRNISIETHMPAQNNDYRFIGMLLLVATAIGAILLSFFTRYSQSLGKSSNDNQDFYKTLEGNQNLKELCNVYMPQVYIDTLSDLQKKNQLSLIKAEKEQIYTNLAYSLNEERLKEVLRERDVEILIMPKIGNNPLVKGRFAPASGEAQAKNVISLLQDSTRSDRATQKVLANELHHLSIFKRNLKKAGSRPIPRSERQLALPFLNEEWIVDEELRQQHRQAIKRGLDRINEFEQLIELYKSGKLDKFPDKRAIFTRYINAVKDYEPNEYTEIFHDLNSRLAIKEKLKTLRKINGRYEMENKGKKFYITSIDDFENQLIVKHNYAASDSIIDRAIALINDLRAMQESIYRGKHYQKKSPVTGGSDMEFSSSIEEFDSQVKETFFIEWCTYFSQYTQTSNYCYRPNRT